MNKNQKDLLAIFLRFLRFGFLAWGGPVAQIGMIKDELVDKEKWISPEKFQRTLAVYQALPGPEAHELCVYFGMIRAGRWGGFLAGLGFMLPGFILMILCAWLYKIYGATTLLPLFIGVVPAVSALIIRAAHRITENILHEKYLIYIGIVSIILTLLRVHFLWIFAFSSFFYIFWQKDKIILAYSSVLILVLIMFLTNPSFQFSFSTAKAGLFIEGLKAGLFSFGGAYTAIPFLKSTMVGNYPEITTKSFLDGIALANVIPAPLVIFGTFLGFLAGSFGGAILITIGIFLPAFSFTLLGHKYLEKFIENKTFHAGLDAISAAVAGILILTAIQILIHSIGSFLQFILFIAALIALYKWKWKWKWNAPIIIISCGIIGYLLGN